MSKVYRYCDGDNNLQEVTVTMNEGVCRFDREYWMMGDLRVKEWRVPLTFTLSNPIDVPLRVDYSYTYQRFADGILETTIYAVKGFTIIAAGTALKIEEVLCRQENYFHTDDREQLPRMQEIL